MKFKSFKNDCIGYNRKEKLTQLAEIDFDIFLKYQREWNFAGWTKKSYLPSSHVSIHL